MPPAHDSSASGSAAGTPGDAQDARNQGERAGERFGPLELTRVRKDDGRALIFFREPRAGEE